ncbi:MAG: hypothetical protein IJT13_01320, partial [Bacteroidaceae bacterium]|nr:hypothetical protein [Bacteroidaceae bacterium]
GVAYKVLKTQIDRDAEKYEEICKRRRENINKRWHKEGQNTKDDKSIQMNTNVNKSIQMDYDNDNENDSESTNVDNKKELSKESKKIAAKAATLARNVETRKKSFYNSLIPYVQMYGKEMVRDFYDYWSELNKSKTKMRFENQPTWEIGKRLTTWAKKENNYGKNRQSNSSEKRAVDAASIVARLAAEDDARK